MSDLFTSDLHFSHANIQIYCPGRPQGSIEDHNAVLVDNWNGAVRPNDTVWVLGDVALGKLADSLPLVALLNGTKHLLAGNHDRCWSGHKKVGDWPQRYLDAGFASITEEAEYTFDDGLVVDMCHFPYQGDSQDEDRYAHRRPTNRGRFLLHGHVHDAWQRNGRQINVGVDVWDYTPVRAETLRELIRTAS